MGFSVVWVVLLVECCGLISGEGFQWFQRDGKIPSRRLAGHVIETRGETFSVLQCAMSCGREHRCQSYNYYPAEKWCEINDASIEEFEEDVQPDDRAIYYSKNVYTIDQAALGPCGQNPCNDRGRCLNTRDPQGETTFLCICAEGWTGRTCNETETTLAWSEWTVWGQCSVSCGGGYQTRGRECTDTETGEVKSVIGCQGRYHDSRTCSTQKCPGWDAWGEWGACSTDATCGPGMKLRLRQCARGGTPGVDRGCMGLHNDTSVCSSPGCDTPIALKAGDTHGEGRLLVYNDLRKEWGPICTDEWDKTDADLVCKQLGFVGAQEVATQFGTSGLPYQLFHVQCTGRERSLQRCQHGGWNDGTDRRQCGSEGDAGIRCIVNGAWGKWAEWGECSRSCAGGQRERVRKCNHPPALRGGSDCEGDSSHFEPCDLGPCPVDSVWLPWEAWDTCTVSCGRGTQVRHRTCQMGLHGGAECEGPASDTQDCNTHHCPIDGVWLTWSNWGTCSLPCGVGIQNRTRQCQVPQFGGENCQGEHIDFTECNKHPCPIDGQWTAWSDWDTCTTSCGGGTQTRTRVCFGQDHGGDECPGSDEDRQTCNENPCPVDGIYDEWSMWSTCTATCGGGLTTRHRECIRPQNGGRGCEELGPSDEEVECNTLECPVDGVWKQWVQWSSCDASCGGGTRSRSRECEGPFFDGADCEGEATNSEPCNTESCPINGVWQSWSEWGACSVSCSNGSQERHRNCTEPLFGGLWCEGPADELRDCWLGPCPVDGHWSQWSLWSWCAVSCGGGIHTRNRECLGVMHGGLQCPGDSMDQEACSTHPCPVDGYYLEWSAWSSCSQSCGGGIQKRSRACVPPRYGGVHCLGQADEETQCSVQPCQVDGVWEEWSAWEVCAVSCGGGIRLRNRTCFGPFYGGNDCEGPVEDSGYCRDNPCPVDGAWSEWTRWLECSSSCGGGQQMRYRTCSDPLHGGADCDGTNQDFRECDYVPCPVDGYWLPWQEWSECSASCAYGTRTRQRECVEEQHEGMPCQGPSQDTEDCFKMECPVDGFWQTWSQWSVCSTTCGNGTKTRQRECQPPLHNGADCAGRSWEEEHCWEKHCPIDGFWHNWSEWGACSVTCSGGIQTRSRECENPQHDGDSCQGDAVQERACWDLEHCPVDGQWAEWSTWSVCTTSCGGGTQTRDRSCVDPQYDGAPCEGPRTSESDCNTDPCPIPGDWMEWGEWGSCSLTCNNGIRYRKRECDMDSHGDLTAPCLGEETKSGPCNTFDCEPMPTCSGWVEKGLMNSGWVEVRPDFYLETFYVWCDTTLRDGVGVSVFHHGHEEYAEVHGYEGSGEYAAIMEYYENVTHQPVAVKKGIELLVDVSEHCEQFISWQCLSAGINPPPNDDSEKKWQLTFWSNRNGDNMIYWGGTRHDIETEWKDLTICACAETKSCANPEMPCNCDKNDNVWRVDEGLLTYKPDLPVTGFFAGDTAQEHEEGKSKVGPLYCWGQVPGAGESWKK